MKSFLIAYVAAITAFLIIDGIWLGLLAKDFYAKQLAGLLRSNIQAAPALLFYLMYTAGLVILAVRPGQVDITLTSVALYGAIVGFLAYGTYNMTNLATIKDWPWLMSIVDLVWGTALSAAVATISSLVLRKFA